MTAIELVNREFEARVPALMSIAPGKSDEGRAEFVRRVKTQVLQLLGGSPSLQRCSPGSILVEVMKGVELGLDFAPQIGHIYIVPYGPQATLIIGYRGMIALAGRCGFRCAANVVCEGDEFVWEEGTTFRCSHRPALKRGAMIQAYAVFTGADGRQSGVVLNRDEIEATRKRSRAGTSGPWQTDYNAMAMKTAIRRGFKLLPIETRLIEMMESYDHDRPEIVADSPPPNEGGRTDDVMARLGVSPPTDALADALTDAPADAPDARSCTREEAWAAYVMAFGGDRDAAQRAWRDHAATLFPGRRTTDLNGVEMARLADAVLGEPRM